jgi:CubicO group peptidase (beta-lactamase class C family)
VIFICVFGVGHSGFPVAWAQASSAFSADVSKYVRGEMEQQHIPGVALLVSRAGKTVQAEGFGLANVELKGPVTRETIFQSGSVGKQFTATAVMMLVEEGKVGLDDPLTKYFPDAPATWNEVTVRELLSHTAGFGDYPDKFDFRKDWTEDELLKMVEGIPVAYPPGTKWDYSNLGFLTLGILIHRVTDECERESVGPSTRLNLHPHSVFWTQGDERLRLNLVPWD